MGSASTLMGGIHERVFVPRSEGAGAAVLTCVTMGEQWGAVDMSGLEHVQSEVRGLAKAARRFIEM